MKGDIIVDDFSTMKKISQKDTDLGSSKKGTRCTVLNISSTNYQTHIKLSYGYDLGENLTFGTSKMNYDLLGQTS